MRTALIVLLFAIPNSFAQIAKVDTAGSAAKPWDVPFASKGNSIALTVSNDSHVEAAEVTATLMDMPEWLEFESTSLTLKDIPPGESKDAEFCFGVSRKAPVGQACRIIAEIASPTGQRWRKEIVVQVLPPREYKLYDNFPNPFNPSTKLAFELPKTTHVRLSIYDMIGREVRSLADCSYPAGYTEIVWDGRNGSGAEVASGVYFCRIATEQWGSVKKMMRLK